MNILATMRICFFLVAALNLAAMAEGGLASSNAKRSDGGMRHGLGDDVGPQDRFGLAICRSQCAQNNYSGQCVWFFGLVRVSCSQFGTPTSNQNPNFFGTIF